MKLFSILLIACAFTFSATAQKYSNATPANVTKEWKGLSFSSEKSLFQNLDETDVFSKSAPLFKGDIIADDAMLTAFVMVDSSFSELDEDAEESLFANSWKKFITYHFIPGRVDSNSIAKAIDNGDGIAYFNTVLGQRLGVKRENGDIVLFDSDGNTAKVIATDFYHKNGFFHVIDGLLMPSIE